MATIATRSIVGAVTVVPLPVTRSSSSSSSSSTGRVWGLKALGSSVPCRQLEHTWSSNTIRWGPSWQVVRALVQEAEQAESEEAVVVEPVVVQDTVSMFFKAEGTLNEASVPKLQKALEVLDGVSNVKAYVSDGAATVELTKVASIQDTGVASGLVEVLQTNGFKMQALNIGFDDDNDDDDGLYEYDDTAAYAEEGEASPEAS
eukprot:TRINITY_DN11823_c0_g1_i1.p1 TRINITY_DN11823_c0_g1~~TRINITY_DN11823_c0_g1_i1.p1  ORF type:complete len:203 (+),score=28.94 TRINITY_DN11823_c0_g1_i1:91-699(+)